MKSRLLLLSILAGMLWNCSLFGQESLLQSGPMVGYGDMREVMLWVQTRQAAEVHFRYFEEGQTGKRYQTSAVTTAKDHAFTAKLLADQVEPGKKYRYELFINGKKVERPYPLRFQTQQLWQYRTDPPAFKVAVGSCFYVNDAPYDRPGKPYGGDYEVLTTLASHQPDLMLWLGDNTYLREPDWYTRTGIYHRYTHTRSLPELQPLLGATHHYAIWDDHEFGPNDSDRSFGMKPVTLDAFQYFWGNPYFGIDGKPGVTFSFEWADAQFFMLDNRYYRTPNDRKTGERTMLGDHQFQWLIDALVSSRATFKFVAIGGQVLNPFVGFEKYSIYAAERDRLLKAIEAEDIEGVIFLSGDIHRTEVTKMERRGAYPLYEITSSPLTAGTYPAENNDANYLRVPDTAVNARNFVIMEFSGPRRDRVVEIASYTKDNSRQWSLTIKATDLR